MLKEIPSNNPLNIAFQTGSDTWAGGSQYLLNLFIALKSLDQSAPIISLLVEEGKQSDGFSNLLPYVDQIITSPKAPIMAASNNGFLDVLKRKVGSKKKTEHYLKEFLETNGVDAVFGQCQFGPAFKFPLVAWIPDFQHLRLPEMFPAQIIEDRNRFYTKIIQNANVVIVSSEDAKKDFQNFMPEFASKAKVLSFVANIPAEIYQNDPGWICSEYHLPQKFVYLPNQFWKHKNHELVIYALNLACQQDPTITIVCTGSSYDYRNPNYFNQLLFKIAKFGLRDRFILLGLVPFDHTLVLMRQSLAVLQPSLFEGWSTTVEEAKSLGKQIILSNIPVQLEQAPPQAIFFEAKDPQILAECLVTIFKNTPPGPDVSMEQIAREKLPNRIRQFGQKFLDITQSVV